MSCSTSIEQKLCEVKIFQIQSMLKAIRCINQRFAFKNVWIWCLALIFNLKNPSIKVLYAKKLVAHVAKYDESCTVFFKQLIRTNGLVVKASRRESGHLGSIPDDFWIDLQRLGHFAWDWARQCTGTRAFYIAVLSIIFFFLDFASGDLALTEL